MSKVKRSLFKNGPRSQLRETFETFIGRLPPDRPPDVTERDYYLTLTYFYHQHWSYQDIADKYGIRRQTVEEILQNTLNRLLRVRLYDQRIKTLRAQALWDDTLSDEAIERLIKKTKHPLFYRYPPKTENK